jgi:hypothetical protein
MIFTIWNGQAFDTEKDLTAAERHILQKLFILEPMVNSLEEFEQRKERAIKLGWNNSGPVNVSHALSMIIEDLEKKVISRLNAG